MLPQLSIGLCALLPLEGIVYDCCLGIFFAAALLCLYLLLDATRAMVPRPGFASFSHRSKRWRHSSKLSITGSAYGNSGYAAEFVFEDAIAAHEALIDQTCSEQRPRHIALVIPTLDRIGGAERQVLLLAKGLGARGWRVSIVALAGYGEAAAAELKAAKAGFVSLRSRKGLLDPRGWIRFILWVRRAKPDVVHAHLASAGWLARWSRLFAPVPVVIDTLHGASTGSIWRRLGYRLSRSFPDHVTAVSRSVADLHLAAKVVTTHNFTVLYNGVDMEEWRRNEEMRAAVRREMGLDSQFLWIAIGRLEAVKDYPTLLKAMATLPRSVRLVVAGVGPMLGSLYHLSARLGLGGRVRFLGFDPNVKRWLQAADGFVLASRWEGLPMALLEASALGLPSVATDVPGIREVIEDGETGMIVPAMDVSALAWAMTAIMQIPAEERQLIGVGARQSIEERFSLQSALDHWEKLYEKLLQEKSGNTLLREALPSKTGCTAAGGQTPAS